MEELFEIIDKSGKVIGKEKRSIVHKTGLLHRTSDVFVLEAEIIEIKEKPSFPIGIIGMDAFGKTPEFVDKGNMLRAILAIGKQDVDYKELIPFDTVNLLGSSSDHIIVDIGESHNIYKTGDTMKFNLTYASILSLMTSKYVTKYYE